MNLQSMMTPFDYTLHSESSFETTFSDFTPTHHGINILGGYCLLRGNDNHRVVIKKVQSRTVLYNNFLVDKLKEIFGLPVNKMFGIPVKFPVEIAYERDIGDRSNVLKEGNYLVQSCIPGITWGDWTDTNWHPTTNRLWLPVEHISSCHIEIESFMRAFLFRMVVGISDPGPHNFMIYEGRVYSIDETSAFGDNLSPLNPSREKRWLRHNLAGPIALSQMRDPEIRYIVHSICTEWRQIEPSIIRECIQSVPLSSARRKQYLDYITMNISRLESDFNILIEV